MIYIMSCYYGFKCGKFGILKVFGKGSFLFGGVREGFFVKVIYVEV